MYSIDLNSDMGESFGAYKIGGDEEIIKYVTTANVACGWHAGDPMVMDKVVRMAKERGVMVGAHPGYPDMMGFGRRKMVLSHDEIKNYVRYQIGALAAFTKSYGMKLQHVAPHGAMGNACQYDEDIASAIVEAICEYDKDLTVREQFLEISPRARDFVQLQRSSQTEHIWMIFHSFRERWKGL